MLFGAHISVSGGYLEALEYAQEVGCECAQIFAKSPRQWRGPAIDAKKAEAFVSARREAGFGPVFSHTAYLINLGTPEPELREKSIAALADEIVRGGVLDVAGVVTHIGTDPLGDVAAAGARVGEAIVEAFDRAGDAATGVRLLLENTAGAGKTFGADFEQLAACISAAGLPPERLGVCIDTCHAFAYGYALDTAPGWDEMLAGIGECCGLDRLGLIHANDCMFERGSKRDRHAWIGDGSIGREGFSAMVCRAELAGVPACAEMPGEVPFKDAENVRRLKELREACPPSQ